MSTKTFAVSGLDGLVHYVTGSWVSITWWNLSYPDMQLRGEGSTRVTTSTAQWMCTGNPAPAMLEVVDARATCMLCIAGGWDA